MDLIHKTTYKIVTFLLIIVGVSVLSAGPSGAQSQGLGGFLSDLSTLASSGETATLPGSSLSGRIIQLFALITILSIAPGLLVIMTSFTRFVIVFSMLRSALGLNQTPPNIVLNSMALFMTLFIMQPVFDDAWQKGLEPLLRNNITEEQAVDRIMTPFRKFMFANSRDKDLALFANFAAKANTEKNIASPGKLSPASIGFRVLVPAFMISELRRAFTIGFLLYLPFIAIDLIVASVLMSAGMMMLPPVMVSLPFKIIFFVLIDGWNMLAGSLMQSYLTFSGGG